ncbi:MAG: 4'-phosphopantetheinyl transferase superfamily protein [Chitinophagales bacterium]|nr:4'-phosphopantetheinyl transferase superfamily protein [Chitinophagales bacterium]
MPIIRELQLPHAHLCLWHITEPPSFFLDRLYLDADDLLSMQQITVASKMLEFLASRYALRYLINLDEEQHLLKDEHGRPTVHNLSKHVSLSHCRGFAAAIIANTHCGIDVEPIDDKVCRIAPRFLSEREHQMLQPGHEVQQMILAWSAKEAVYKAYGKKGVAFKDPIMINALPSTDQGHFTVRLQLSNLSKQYAIGFERLNGLYWTWSIESNEPPTLVPQLDS